MEFLDSRVLLSAAENLGIEINDGQLEKLEIYARLLCQWNEKMNLTATTGAGVLVRQGQMSDGVWFWTFQYPVRMRLVGQTTSKPEQSFVFEITIQRVDPRLKPSGMEIRQMISRNAGPNS